MPVITCGSKEINVPYHDTVNSEYIKDIVELSNNVDVVISVPDKYYTIIDTYIDYLKNNKTLITDRKRLFLCFQLSTLFVDDSYFKYCVQQTFNNWSYMCVMVYNEFIDDLQWSFFVHSPYDFIPEYLLNNNTFMTQWNKLNQNVVIKVNNDNEVYYNNATSINDHDQRIIKTFHIVKVLDQGTGHAKEIGRKKETVYYENSNNVRSEGYYIDGKLDGSWNYWYDTQGEINEQQTTGIHQGESLRHTEGILPQGERLYHTEGILPQGERLYHTEGISKDEWLRCACHHTLKSEEHYVNGKQDGLWRQWYNNEHHTLKSEEHYVNGNRNGLWKHWYDTQGETIDQHTLVYEEHYVDDKLHGLWREWYDGDQNTLAYEGQYVNGKPHGLCREWYDNDQHTLAYEGHYVDGKRNGLCREWYDNDQHTLAYEGHYVDGKRNGNITFDGDYVNDAKQY